MNKGLMIAVILAVAAMAGIAIAKQSQVNSGGGYATDSCTSEYAIVNVGETARAGNLKVMALDVLPAQGPNNEHPAVYAVFTQSNNFVGYFHEAHMNSTVNGVYEAPNGNQTYSIYTMQTAPGFTLNAKWAELVFTVCRL